jgi:sugar (pentulose or hexulose) kinase
MELISVIDAGTGSIRNTIYELSGEVVDVGKNENPLIHPQAGWAEQDTAAWWSIVKKQFLDMDPATRAQITAITVTSQREGIVPVNEDFLPLDNMIIWLDGRTVREGEEIVEKLGEEEIYNITGLVANPAWSLSKILWIRKNKKAIYQETYKFLQAEDYLLSRLTRRAVSELSIASRTCMLEVAQRKWSHKILETFELDENKLPELLEPGSPVGTVPGDIAGEFGLPEGVRVFTGAGDQQAAALGVGALEEGMVSIGIGTSSALSMTLDQPVRPRQHKIILNCAAVPGKWEYEPPIWNTGGLIKWFVENMQGEDMSYEDLLLGAASMPAGSDGLTALPYFSGAGSPRWNPGLKGGFYGLGLHHNRHHMLRSIMESIAFEIKFNIDSIRSSGILLKKVILSGGASKNRPLCQIISDVLQENVEVFVEAEASSRGVFLLAREAIQDEGGQSPGPAVTPEYISFTPDRGNRDIYDRFYLKYIELGNHMEKLKN